MTTTNIIGVVVLVGGVLGYGALFLWVLTEDKRKECKEEKKCTKASIIVTIAASGWTCDHCGKRLDKRRDHVVPARRVRGREGKRSAVAERFCVV